MAFFQEAKSSREPFISAPASVIALIAVILAAHTARILLPEALSNEVIETGALIPARYVPEVWATGSSAPVSIWDGLLPFVAYLFLHADFLHAGVNCIWLLVAGTPVARRFGTVRFLALFVVSGVTAGAVFLAANWPSFAAAVGASGAVSGMMGAAIRIFYGQRSFNAPASANDNLPAPGMRPPLAPIFSGSVLFFSLIWVVVNIVAGVTGLGTSGEMQAVAWEAHLGGYFAGLLLVGPFDAIGRRRPAASEDATAP
jgi:membrane associated rhomboid family serine protease